MNFAGMSLADWALAITGATTAIGSVVGIWNSRRAGRISISEAEGRLREDLMEETGKLRAEVADVNRRYLESMTEVLKVRAENQELLRRIDSCTTPQCPLRASLMQVQRPTPS